VSSMYEGRDTGGKILIMLHGKRSKKDQPITERGIPIPKRGKDVCSRIGGKGTETGRWAKSSLRKKRLWHRRVPGGNREIKKKTRGRKHKDFEEVLYENTGT